MLRPIFFSLVLILAFSIVEGTSHAAGAASGVKGDWDVIFTIAGQSAEGTISLDVSGKALTGTVFSEHTGKGAITNGTFENDKLACTLTFEKHESIALSGEYKDDKLSGTFATEGTTGTWTAVRKK